MQDLFLGSELSKQDLQTAVKQTRWTRLDKEILELEIKKGMDEIDAGYNTTIKTKGDIEILLANVKRRGLRKLKAKQRLKLKNQPVI